MIDHNRFISLLYIYDYDDDDGGDDDDVDVMMTVYNHTPMINSSIITCDNVILTQ
jgi:hypothetical protein